LCYGSLKKGFHNNWRLGEDAKLLGEDVVVGAMYLHFNYPKLYKPDTRQNAEYLAHKCEIWEIDASKYRRIHNMEMAERYEEDTITTLIDPEVKIFWMPWSQFDANDMPIKEYTQEIINHQNKHVGNKD
jgi:gamma-glutamylcyclotransferase (GGCT)/AIG2-like uncharacterized protein YtfP